MLTYNIVPNGAQSLYEQLYHHIREDIAAGRLRAHDRLPSKRSFAKNLGLSNTTVESAYAQLVTEGYLYSLPKRGFFVSPLEGPSMPAAFPAPAAARAQERAPIPAEVGEKREAEDCFADLLSSGVSTKLFPFSVWMKLLRHVMASEDEESLLTQRPAAGLARLRRAIADHLRDFRGMQVSPEQVIVGAGTEYLYAVLIQLLGRDRIYGVEDPGYLRLSWIYERNDVRACCHLPMDEAGVVPEALAASGTQILHITPSHHFPTGIVMPVSRRYELLSWAEQQEGRYLIEDDYDCEFRLAGKPIPSLQSIDHAEKVIYINTFSQSLAPAFRMSYLVLPPALLARFQERLGFYSGTVSCFEQLTLARFLEGGHFERHINRMRTQYRSLRDLLLRALRACALGSCTRILAEDAGVHFLLEVQTKKTAADLLAAAADEGIKLSCLSDYYYDKKPSAYPVLVINYAGLPPEKCEELVQRLQRCILP